MRASLALAAILAACAPAERRCTAADLALILVEVGMPEGSTTVANARADHAVVCSPS